MTDSVTDSVKTMSKNGTNRFAIYEPENVLVPDQFLPNPDYIYVQDQGQNPVGGRGLASMINYLLCERGIYERVSIPMLEYLITKTPGYGEVDKTTSYFQMPELVQAWFEQGACLESLWPDEPKDSAGLTPERSQAALKYKPVSCLKIPKEASVLRAAIYNHHAAVGDFQVHEGWLKPMGGVIDFKPNFRILGGQAVAILGYTAEGFIIQNSWGLNWGGLRIGNQIYPGAALLTYPDFDAHYQEGFVAALSDNLIAHPLLRRAGYESDTLESKDRLDIMQDVEAVCSVLAARDTKPPLALGLFGNWGTGKSFFMARMQEEIESLSKLEREYPGETPYCGEIVQVRFNAWHYLDANLWASLVSEIFNNLFGAVSGGNETPEHLRRRVLRQLGQARGLYRQSRMELEQAKQEREIAEANLQMKTEKVKSQQASVAELSDQLATLLMTEPAVKEDLDQVAQLLGAPQVAQSYSALKAQAEEIETFQGRVRKVLRVIFNPQGRRERLILLVGLLIGPTLIGALVTYLSQNASGLLAEISRVVNLASGLLISLIALSAQLLRGKKVLDSLQNVMDKVERVRGQRLVQLVQPEQARLDRVKLVAREAQAQLEAAKQRVESLEKELDEQSPSYQMQAFIKERTSSEDYKKQLGLISLVRRDFDRLSELWQTSEALETRWYERRRAAQDAGKKFTQPKRRLLPIQRIVLYIDDLDRCGPDRVIEVLEAVHLLLAFPMFVVVVAVDPRWLRRCLEMHYPDLLSTNTKKEDDEEGLGEPSTPQDYLEKIFQIPLYLRPINDAGYRSLIDGLMGPDVALESKQPPTSTGPEGKAKADEDMIVRLPMIPGPTIYGDTQTNIGSGRPDSESLAVPLQKEEQASKKLNPEQLKFQSWEIQDVKRLSPLFRTPRAVKRFINTYRLIRVGVASSDLPAFEGTAQAPGRYRVAQVLLAIVSGYPTLAPRFLQRLLDKSRAVTTQSITWKLFLDECIDLGVAKTRSEIGEAQAQKDNRISKAGIRGTTKYRKHASATIRPNALQPLQQSTAPKVAHYWLEWIQLCETLRNISHSDFLPDSLNDYYDLVPKVARFSFSVSVLPE